MDSRFRAALDAFQRGELEVALDIATANGTSAPEWQHLLGLIECRKGNLRDGIAHLRAASDARPEDESFRLMLGRALLDSGADAEVLAMPEPANVTRAALALWHVRAEAAYRLADHSATTKAWHSATAISPGDHRAWINLARALLRLDSFAEAAEAYGRALALAPNDVAVTHELSLVHERMNEIGKMAEMLESALAAGLSKESLAFAWALLEQRRGNPAEAQRLLALPGADRDRVRWQRLVARVEDMLGNSREAFAAAVEMNRGSPDFDLWRRRAEAYRHDLRALADVISTQWPSELPTVPTCGTSPAFIVGFPRSGTTLLDTFLMGHSDVVVLEELPLLGNAAELAGPLKHLPYASTADLEAARERYLTALAEAVPWPTPKLIIDKFPLNMLAAPLIHCLFPASPIIFAQRHPCDAVLSAVMQSFVSNLANANFLDLADAADFYDACMTVWTASAAKLPLKVHTVCYEELVTDSEATLRPLVADLGLDWQEAMLDHRSAAKRRGTVPNTSYRQVTEPLGTTPVLRWRRYEQELAPVLPVLLPWAERLGYSD